MIMRQAAVSQDGASPIMVIPQDGMTWRAGSLPVGDPYDHGLHRGGYPLRALRKFESEDRSLLYNVG